MLATLKKLAVSATFCVLGKNLEERKEPARAYRAHGHEATGHGYTHRAFPSLSYAELRDELARTRALAEGVAIRAPTEGRYRRALAREAGLSRIHGAPLVARFGRLPHQRSALDRPALRHFAPGRNRTRARIASMDPRSRRSGGAGSQTSWIFVRDRERHTPSLIRERFVRRSFRRRSGRIELSSHESPPHVFGRLP
jgi:peptidoglycan/xylan/chitin deacetylase (PgdA/CDA1 family)